MRTRFESPDDTAARYGVTRKTIEKSVRALHITEYRPGPRCVRYDVDEIDAAFSGHLVQRGNNEPQPA